MSVSHVCTVIHFKHTATVFFATNLCDVISKLYIYTKIALSKKVSMAECNMSKLTSVACSEESEHFIQIFFFAFISA
jgi:hypothetical protein